MDIFSECNAIRYAAYRTAAKILTLQRYLKLEQVRLGIVAGVFYRHQLELEVNLQQHDIEAVISDILFASEKETHQYIDIDVITKEIVLAVYRIHDRKNKKHIKTICVQVTLTVLCSASLQEKYQYLFHQLSDHNNCITKKKFELLLTCLADITEYLSEFFSFGSHLIPTSIKCCFKNVEGNLGVPEDEFLCWVLNEPQLLVWFSTFYRLSSAAKVSHPVRCDVCKNYPIRGLRYVCLVCLKYNQCQTCFFTGKISKQHKITHPMEEYCIEVSSKLAVLIFFRVLKNKLRRRPFSNIRYIPAHLKCTSNTKRCHFFGESTTASNSKLTGTARSGSKNDYFQSPQSELQNIICKLEDENRQLLEDMHLCGNNVENCLQNHRAHIEMQIERLKLLKFHLINTEDLASKPVSFKRMCHLESTPARNYRGPPVSSDLDTISPIVKEPEGSIDKTRLLSWQYDEPGASSNDSVTSESKDFTTLPSPSEKSIGDLSTHLYKGSPNRTPGVSSGVSVWLKKTECSQSCASVREFHDDLDAIIEKLQQLLTTNFSVQDTLLCDKDNLQLQQAATEMEGLLAGLIKNVEHNKLSSSCVNTRPVYQTSEL